MADPIRLFAEFTDDLGTDYRVNIHDANFTGTATTFVLASDGFVLRYTGDNENRMQGVIGSELTFTLTEENTIHTVFMDDISTTQELRFSVSVFKDPDNTNTNYWRGVLYPEQVIRPFDYYPIQNTLTAADDIGNLQYLKHDSTGAVDVPTLLLQCLNRTRATHLWDTDAFLYYVNDFKAAIYTGSNQLDHTLINNLSLGNPDSNGINQYYSTIEILESITKVFNARLFQSQGVWWFLPLGAQKFDATELTVEGKQKNGTDLTQQLFAADRPFNSTLVRTNGYEYSNLVPLKEVKRTRRYNGNYPLIYDNLYTEAEFGTTLNDTDIDYAQDTEFLITGTFNYAYDGDGTASGDNRIARVVLRFSIKVGTQYLKRDANFTGTTNDFLFLVDEGVLQYSSVVYGSTQWTATPEYYEVVSPVFDRKDGGEITMPIVINTPLLPSAQNGLDLSVAIVGVDDTGGFDGSLVSTSTADFQIVVLRADLLGNNALGDEITYTATNSDEARGKIDQGLCIFGDGITQNSDGVILVIEGVSAEAVTQWESLNAVGANIGINRLGVSEILAGQNKATPIQRGTVYGSDLHMWQVLDDTTGYFALFQLTFTARSVETDVEAFLIARDATTTTTAFEDAINVNDPITHNPGLGVVGATNSLNRFLLIGEENFGSRVQHRITSVTNRAGTTYNVRPIDYMVMNTWAGGNGTAIMYLPSVADNEGRAIQFHSDATISANTNIQLRANTADSGVTIDGAASYAFNRNYDGITILCHDSNWFIIQKKEK